MVKNHYSIAVCPDKNTVGVVDRIKKQIQQQIGWYNSYNAEAHISFGEFHLTDDELVLFEKQLIQSLAFVVEFPVCFNQVELWGQTLCFTADKQSAIQLKNVFSALLKRVALKGSFTPHISIGRHMSHEKLPTVVEQLKVEANEFRFLCNGIFIRKLVNGQFHRFSFVPFGQIQLPQVEQGTLF